jgi:uncharacterized membrane protein YeaQ/YmgE (transglycosylase-associated protein family)
VTAGPGRDLPLFFHEKAVKRQTPHESSQNYVSLHLVYSRWAAMHAHITLFWTIVLGIIGSILGGAITHIFSRPANERFHPAGLIFSTVGAILVLYVCHRLKIHFPQIGSLNLVHCVA